MTATTEEAKSRSATANLIQHRDDSEIRERLLHKLGIFGDNSSGDSSTGSSSDSSVDSQQSSKASPRLSRQHHKKELENEYRYAPTPPPPSPSRRKSSTDVTNSTEATTGTPQPHSYLPLLNLGTRHRELLELHPHLAVQEEKKTRFVPYVTVVDIPSHRDYPHEIYQNLWNTPDEIRYNGLRNSLEFRADNGDWRKAKEEDVFIGVDGELFHPESYRQLIKKRPSKMSKKTKGNNPKKSMQRGRNLARINAMRAEKIRSSKSAPPSLTRFSDS